MPLFFFAILKTMNIWVFPPRFEPFRRGTKRRPLTLLHKLITAAWAASTSPCPALHRSRCLHSLCTQSHRLCCDRSNSCLRCRSAFYAGAFRLPHTWYMIETAAMPTHLSSPRVHTHVCTVTYTRVCNVSRGVNSSESTTYNTSSSMCSCCRNGINPLLIYFVDRFKASSIV
jgi:predicted deacetylase